MPTDTAPNALSQSRAISAAEFLIGAALVIGHNVYKVVPNEVVLLFVIGLISARLRNGSFAAFGFRRPNSWTRIVLIALAAAAIRLLIGDGVLVPIAQHFWPPAETSAVIEDLEGSLADAALTLLLVWTFAAFGEEIAYRGYLLNRCSEAIRTSTGRKEGTTDQQTAASPMPTWALVISAVLTSILFGYGHYYKGPVGILDSTFAGLVLAAAYLITGRNLWACVLAHGFIDTIAVTLTYFGWVD